MGRRFFQTIGGGNDGAVVSWLKGSKMSYKMRLMFCGTAGRWSGDVGRLDNSVQQIAERHQISPRQYNASSDYSLCINGSGSEHISGIRADVCESQRGELSQYRNIELPIAKCFGNVIRVCYRRLITADWPLLGPFSV